MSFSPDHWAVIVTPAGRRFQDTEACESLGIRGKLVVRAPFAMQWFATAGGVAANGLARPTSTHPQDSTVAKMLYPPRLCTIIPQDDLGGGGYQRIVLGDQEPCRKNRESW